MKYLFYLFYGMKFAVSMWEKRHFRGENLRGTARHGETLSGPCREGMPPVRCGAQ